MYKSIPNNLTNKELTSVVHFVVKMLNKYKSEESRQIKISDLAIKPSDELLPVCLSLLEEIVVEDLEGKDEVIDHHIQSLFSVLTERLNSEIDYQTSRGQELLEKFRNSDI